MIENCEICGSHERPGRCDRCRRVICITDLTRFDDLRVCRTCLREPTIQDWLAGWTSPFGRHRSTTP